MQRGEPTHAEDARIPEPGEVIASRYVVDRVLGTGGSSVVCRAFDKRLALPVAVKILKSREKWSREHLLRLVREAQIVANLRSEHIVRVLDVDASADPPYLVMELLEGVTLAELLRARGPVSVELAVRIVAQATRAVADAHAMGIIHRDLKPSNIMLIEREGGADRTIKVIDFGLSRSIVRDEASDITSSGRIVGSPRYMAPEQVRGSPNVDARSDVWALGAILYELLAGTPAFDGATVADTLARIVGAEPSQLAAFASRVPRRVASIVRLCLAKDPALRPPSARVLLEELLAMAGPGAIDLGMHGDTSSDGAGTATLDGSSTLHRPAASRWAARSIAVIAVAAFAMVGSRSAFRALQRPQMTPMPALPPAPEPDASPEERPTRSSAPPLPLPLPLPLPSSDTERAAPRTVAPSAASRPLPNPPAKSGPAPMDSGMSDQDLELNRRE